jgi:hypothetical protein
MLDDGEMTPQSIDDFVPFYLTPIHTRHKQTQGVVMVGVTHSNLGMSMPDIRLDLHTTVWMGW